MKFFQKTGFNDTAQKLRFGFIKTRPRLKSQVVKT